MYHSRPRFPSVVLMHRLVFPNVSATAAAAAAAASNSSRMLPRARGGDRYNALVLRVLADDDVRCFVTTQANGASLATTYMGGANVIYRRTPLFVEPLLSQLSGQTIDYAENGSMVLTLTEMMLREGRCSPVDSEQTSNGNMWPQEERVEATAISVTNTRSASHTKAWCGGDLVTQESVGRSVGEKASRMVVSMMEQRIEPEIRFKSPNNKSVANLLTRDSLLPSRYQFPFETSNQKRGKAGLLTYTPIAGFN